MKKLIIGASLPNKLYYTLNDIELTRPRLRGLPGILTVLPSGDNVRYFSDYSEIYSIDDSQVELYMFEVYGDFDWNDRFGNWLSTVDKEKIVMGGPEITARIEDHDILKLNVGKLVIGRCDDIFATIEQSSRIVEGITNYKKLPRYDLFDYCGVVEKYKVANHGLNDYGIATSFGCLNACDFCSESINPYFDIKPLDYLDLESKMMVDLYGTSNTCFLYDSNFTQSKVWKDALNILKKNKFSKYISFFGSANSIKPEDVDFMKQNNVYCVSMGLEDITKEYGKNRNIVEVCERLYDNQISLQLSYIVNPEDMANSEKEKAITENLLYWFMKLKPIHIRSNFLSITYKTRLYYKYLNNREFDMSGYFKLKKSNDFDRVYSFLRDEKRSIEIINNQSELLKTYYSSDIYKEIRHKFSANPFLDNR